jgi:four helix bundle protein
MKIPKFEELIAWQRAQDLAVLIYKLTENLSDYSFQNQMRRASVSISNNIAEGFSRSSKPDFKSFLFYAKGSCSEVNSMAYLANRISIPNELEKEKTIMLCDEIRLIIKGLIRKIS